MIIYTAKGDQRVTWVVPLEELEKEKARLEEMGYIIISVERV
jgi:cob(I)alamin adenosyltransferase